MLSLRLQCRVNHIIPSNFLFGSAFLRPCQPCTPMIQFPQRCNRGPLLEELNQKRDVLSSKSPEHRASGIALSHGFVLLPANRCKT